MGQHMGTETGTGVHVVDSPQTGRAALATGARLTAWARPAEILMTSLAAAAEKAAALQTASLVGHQPACMCMDAPLASAPHMHAPALASSRLPERQHVMHALCRCQQRMAIHHAAGMLRQLPRL